MRQVCYVNYVRLMKKSAFGVHLAILGRWACRLGMYPVEQASSLVLCLGLIAEKGHSTVERKVHMYIMRTQFVDVPGRVMITWPVVQASVQPCTGDQLWITFSYQLPNSIDAGRRLGPAFLPVALMPDLVSEPHIAWALIRRFSSLEKSRKSREAER